VIFCALDFETASRDRHSACQIGLARFEDGKLVKTRMSYIKPPIADDAWVFEYLHGIGPNKVAKKPYFDTIWPRLQHMIDGCDFIVAHNSEFDRDVLGTTARHYNMAPRFQLPWKCTLQMSRSRWGYGAHVCNRLSSVCAKLNIPLKHHDAASDALAAGLVYLKLTAIQDGEQAASS
jgi:DNA polymerase-3 subunit epsilon